MKRFLFLAATLILSVSSSSASVWNYPQDGATVGNPTLFDCSAPATANYMKLWINGSSTSIWTVHNTNRLAFVYFLPNGTYTMNCQYNDGTTHDNLITITVTNNLYDANNVDDDPFTNTNPNWEQTPGCSSPCTTPDFDTLLDTQKSTDGQSREFSASLHSGGGSFQDVFFYEKRCGGSAVIGRKAGHYMVNVNVEEGSTPRAFEFGFTQWFGGRNYRMAFQADYADGVWRAYDPAGNAWHSTNVTLTQAPIPTTEFKRLFLVGHPFTDSGGNERTAVDLIQMGECTTAPCADTDPDPIHAVAITSVSGEPSTSVPTITGDCFGTEGNSQSLQLDLESSHGSSQIWTDKYLVHLLP
ncbi:MAG TPA: hypothetical protein VGH51_14065 [Candidatus Angelobacter sp.]|jgi:hypothetical protein